MASSGKRYVFDLALTRRQGGVPCGRVVCFGALKLTPELEEKRPRPARQGRG